MARSHERRVLETQAIEKGLGDMIRRWKERGEFVRLKVMEFLFVKGWANRDVAALWRRATS
jgi:RNA polymerase sigma-70 factor, ECF subfamily